MAIAREVDAVVIGGGLAGLAAARALDAAGVDCAVIEARDRVGGRTWSTEVEGMWVDLGAQWIGPTQERMLALAAGYGLETFTTYHAGRKLLDHDGRVRDYRTPIPILPPHHMVGLARLLAATWSRGRRVDLGAPARSPGAVALDGQTVASFERRLTRSRTARAVADVAIRTIFGAEPGEISLLYYLFYARAGGGLLNLIGTEGAAQDARFVLGAQTVASRIAAGLGDRVITGRPVRAIDQRGARVRVLGPELEVSGRRAIVAIPPALFARLELDPPMPADRAQLFERMPMGITAKVHLIYERPFWRERGQSGELASTAAPVTATFDNSSADGSVAALLAFVVGAPARRWASLAAADRRAAILDQLGRCFGDEARRPVAYVEQNWADEPFTGGCPTGVLAPGALTGSAATLAAPLGKIHVAGTETADRWCGYMEGAVRSGERAAAELTARL